MRKRLTRGTSVLATVIAPFVVLLLFSIADNLRAEPSSDQPTTSIVLGGRGGLTPEPPVLVPAQEGTAPSIEVGARAGFASDYIYRGVTLSDHKPAVGTAIEAALGPFYAGTT